MLRGTFSSGLVVCFLFMSIGERAFAQSPVPLETYLTKVFIAVALLGVAGTLLVRWGPRFRRASGSGLEVLTSLSLGRGVIYVVRFCSEIILIGETKGGFSVLGRYPAEQWESLHGFFDKKDNPD